MNSASRGIRNAFRNVTRTVSIVLILGMSIGLSMIMLIANRAVEAKIKTTLSSIGTTINIHPAGFDGSGVSSALTNDQINKVKKVPHITKVSSLLNGRLQPKGTTGDIAPPGAVSRGQGDNNTTAETNLHSPFSLNCKKGACISGGMGFSSSDGRMPQLPSNFSLSIPVVGTNAPMDPAVLGATKITILSGSAIDGNKDTDNAMISKGLAEKNNLKVGSTFTAYGKTLTVAAIFDANTRTGGSSVVISLPALQRYTKQSGVVTRAVATVDSLVNLESATTAVRNIFGDSVDVTSPLDEANRAIEPLKTVKNVSLYSLIGSAVAGAVVILLTMVMIVRERKREIGVLKAIGFSNVRIMFQFVSEALTFTLLAATIGIALGVMAGGPVTSTLVQNSSGRYGDGMMMGKQFENVFAGIRDIQVTVGWEVIVYGLVAAALIALIGSAVASLFIAKVRPAEVLRSE